MYKISDKAADFLVNAAEVEIQRLTSLLSAGNIAGRISLRNRIYDLTCAVSGLNSGEGVVRESVRAS